MSNNIFSTQNVVMSILLAGLGWGGMQINNLSAATAINTDRSNKISVIIPKISESISNIESNIKLVQNDIGYVKKDIVEIKKSQKNYQ